MAKAKKEFICDPLNQCIYCGKTGGTYTDEHIIPAGLDGTWTLPKASCTSCQKITSRFETKVLRGFLHKPRIAMKSFTRKRKDRPATLPLIINDVTYDVPVDEHPANLLLVDFIPPTFDTGNIPKPGVHLRSHGSSLYMDKVNAFYLKNIYPNLSSDEKREIERRGNHDIRVTTSVTFDFTELAAFAQLLAKIAYCLAIARLGKDRIQNNLIVPLILGKDTFYNHFVGTVPIEQPLEYLPPDVWNSEETDHPNKHEIHRLTLGREGRYWVVYIQLYRNRYNGKNPIHKVIVGNA